MKPFVFLFFLLCSFSLHAKKQETFKKDISYPHWERNMVLKPTERKEARTAILIIAPPAMGNSFVENRWKIGKKVWEQYMNSHSNVDCYFVQSAHRNPELAELDQVTVEGNTIYVGDWWYDKCGADRILHKTIVAMEHLLPHYTHFVRTNLNTFLDLKSVNEYMETHHQSLYTTPLWQSAWYAIGYGIVYTADVGTHIVKEYRRLEAMQEELISTAHADDSALTALATGVWPYDKEHPFRCCSSLSFRVRQLMCEKSLSLSEKDPSGDRLCRYGALLLPPISLEKALEQCRKAPSTMMLYRSREGLNLNELAQFYGYLLHKTYPELSCINLEEYVSSLPKN